MRKTCMIAVVSIAAAASGQVINETLQLVPVGAINFPSEYGRAVAIDGDLAVVGSIREDGQRGAAYVFDVTTGQQIARLAADVSPPTERFGYPVAISGTKVLASATSDVVRARSFVFDAVSGALEFTLAPASAPDGWLFGFGYGISIESNVAVIGSVREDDEGDFTGAAYVFDVANGSDILRLTASDGQAGDFFGFASGISSSRAVVGALRHDDIGMDSGAAYVFDLNTGAELMKLLAADGNAGDRFGSSIGVHGSTAIIGAPDADGGGPGTGAAYIFDLTTGQQVAKLVAPDLVEPSRFGSSVGISGSLAVVGAPLASESGVRTGGAYVFDVNSGAFLAKLVSSAIPRFFGFGEAVDISGSRVVVGHAEGLPNGWALVFDVSILTSCTGDIGNEFGFLGPDGMVGFGDFLALLGLVGPCTGGLPICTGDIADDFGTLNGGDGMVSFGDFLALLGLVGPCP